MREAEIKKLLGNDKALWRKFLEWMGGQTVAMYPDGETDFYECDVNAFLAKIKTGYDRQKDPSAWD